jgi:hypothetical protein
MISIPLYGHSDNYTYMIQSIIPDNHFQRAIKSKNTKLYSQTFLFQWPKGQCCPNSIPSTAAPRPYHTLWSCKTQARWASHFAWAVAGRQRQLNSWLYFRDTRPPNVYSYNNKQCLLTALQGRFHVKFSGRPPTDTSSFLVLIAPPCESLVGIMQPVVKGSTVKALTSGHECQATGLQVHPPS